MRRTPRDLTLLGGKSKAEEATVKRAILVLAVAVPLASASPAPAADRSSCCPPGAQPSGSVPDVLDCGSDTRDWLDPQVDVDFPTPPPRELDPVLLEMGCPTSGEPRYRGPFDADAGQPDERRETTEPDQAPEPQPAQEGQAKKKPHAKKCAKKKGKRGKCKKRRKGAKREANR